MTVRVLASVLVLAPKGEEPDVVGARALSYSVFTLNEDAKGRDSLDEISLSWINRIRRDRAAFADATPGALAEEFEAARKRILADTDSYINFSTYRQPAGRPAAPLSVPLIESPTVRADIFEAGRALGKLLNSYIASRRAALELANAVNCGKEK